MRPTFLYLNRAVYMRWRLVLMLKGVMQARARSPKGKGINRFDLRPRRFFLMNARPSVFVLLLTSLSIERHLHHSIWIENEIARSWHWHTEIILHGTHTIWLVWWKKLSDYCGRPINLRVNNLFALLFCTRDWILLDWYLGLELVALVYFSSWWVHYISSRAINYDVSFLWPVQRL